MAEEAKQEYNWGDINGTAAERLRAPKIPDVPKPIVRQAQRSYDGVPDPKNDGEKLHVLEHRFGSEEQAAAFAKHMRNAGHHTTPVSSVSAVIDPEESGDKQLVRWRAGARRGRSAS